MGQFHQLSTSSFYVHRSQKHKKETDYLTVFFALWGSAGVKIAHGTLMKLTPGLLFIKLYFCKWTNNIDNVLKLISIKKYSFLI